MIKINLDISIVWVIAIAGIVMTLQTFCSLPYLHYLIFGIYYFLFFFKMKTSIADLEYRLLIKLLLDLFYFANWLFLTIGII